MNNQNRQVLLMVIHLMKLLKSLPFYKRLNYTAKISFLIFIHPLCAKDEPLKIGDR